MTNDSHEAPKRLWITYSAERLAECDALEAFTTEEESKEWKHVGPTVQYVLASEYNAALARAEKAEAERDEARDWVRRMQQANVTTCLFCGLKLPSGADSETLTEHALGCEKHPIWHLTQERDQLRARAKELTTEKAEWERLPLVEQIRQLEELVSQEEDRANENARELHMLRAVTLAYLHDRAEQYKNSSGTRAALDILMDQFADEEHIKAWKHGELDDLIEKALKVINGKKNST